MQKVKKVLEKRKKNNLSNSLAEVEKSVADIAHSNSVQEIEYVTEQIVEISKPKKSAKMNKVFVETA